MAGKKLTHDPEEFVRIVMSAECHLVHDGALVDRNDSVWKELAIKLKNKLRPLSIFVMVAKNQYGLRDKLLGSKESQHKSMKRKFNFKESSSSSESFDDHNISQRTDNLKFSFIMSTEDINNLTEVKYYNRINKRGNGSRKRLWRVWRHGIYQDYFVKKIWEATHMKCGFLFDTQYINLQNSSGKITAHCKCGSKLICTISKIQEIDAYKVDCLLDPGDSLGNSCGKPYLRNPIRGKIGENLMNIDVERFLAEVAKKCMTRQGDEEAPLIRKPSVYYNTKCETLKKEYVDPDPIKALKILKYGKLCNCIEDIGYDPFYVHYSINESLQLYKKLCCRKTEKITLSLDTTAGTVKKIGNKTIFLHLLGIGIQEGQFSLAHMLSEVSHAEAVSHWLKMWRRSGAPVPDALVTDWSKALLNACVHAFTEFGTIEEYADSLDSVNLKKTKIFLRLDVAHTMHKYAQFFNKVKKPVKTFYLACIGQLITSKSKKQAKDIIRKLLLVSLSPSDGYLKNGKPTACEVADKELHKLITDETNLYSEEISDESPNLNQTDPSKESNDSVDIIDLPFELKKGEKYDKNAWHAWAGNILKEVKEIIRKEKGDRINALEFKSFANYLIKDITLLPLWTNIVAKELGFDESNPTSASVEQIFKKIKNHIFQNHELPARIDIFVEKHISYLQGKSLLVSSKINEKENAVTPLSTSPEMVIRHTSTPKSIVEEENTIGKTLEEALGTEITNDTPEFPIICPACRIDGEASGSHSCIICSKKVHALETCSVPHGEEGFGQSRICLICHNETDVNIHLALREYDNWGNKGLSNENIEKMLRKKKYSLGKENSLKKKKSLYLGQKKTKVKDILTIVKHRRIPVIRNGNSKTLAPINIDGKTVVLQNTCAFDTIFQIFLAGTYDMDTISDYVSQGDSTFFDMIQHVRRHGLTNHTYTLRGKCLSQVSEMKIHEFFPNSYKIMCEENIGTVLKSILPEYFYSYTERRLCKIHGESVDIFKTYNVSTEDLMPEKLDETIKECARLSLRSRKCQRKDCEEELDQAVELGNILIMEISQVYDSKPIQLKKFRTEYCYDETITLHLFGIAEYHHYSKKINEQEIGHYTSLSLRSDKTWIRCDGNKADGTNLPIAASRTKVFPALIFLMKSINGQ